MIYIQRVGIKNVNFYELVDEEGQHKNISKLFNSLQEVIDFYNDYAGWVKTVLNKDLPTWTIENCVIK